MHDLVIRGGTSVDGTGAPARTADVAVSGGTITALGRVGGPARRAVDADGLQLHDLPGGAGRLVQRSQGYVATFVAGVQTIDRDERTADLPGRLVRGAR